MENKEYLDQVITKYINKNFKINRWQIKKRLRRADEDIISELQQYYYVWIYTHLDMSKVKKGYEEATIGMIFSKLINHPSIYKMHERLKRGIFEFESEDEWTNIIETLADEETEHVFTNGHLNAKEDFETRKELFYIARDETVDWLMENPKSNTAIAIENTIKKVVKIDNKKGSHFHPSKVRSMLIDYITAPNINFLKKLNNYGVNQDLITMFREEFAALYDTNGGKPVYQSQLPTAGWY